MTFRDLDIRRAVLAISATFIGVAATASLASCSPSHQHDAPSTPLAVKVLVATMFDVETSPWLQNEKLNRSIAVPGVDKPVHCDTEGLCVATIGEGKANAAMSMSAILHDEGLDLTSAYVISAGVAGIRPDTGTLGDADWADWIVDYEIGGHHIAKSTDPSVPFGYEKGEDEGTTVFHLNPELVATAYALTKDLPLADSADAQANRAHYASQAGKKLQVSRCDTVTADDFWMGSEPSDTAKYVVSQWTDNAGRYCTSQQEDSATAAVLAKNGYLDRYLSLRTASDFDQPYPGESLHDMLSTFPGIGIAAANAYTVASAVAHHFANIS